MKILVLQLARFGDIYLTWPALRALRRKHPEAEIHLLVREKFAEAAEGIGSNVIIHTLPSARIFEPLFRDNAGVSSCQALFEKWLLPLEEKSWDQIINLSFSPASSYLADLLRRDCTEIFGYTRHSDGFLAIPDDASAYFYAQVGPGKYNRFHLSDIFGMVAQVELTDADWGLAGGANPRTISNSRSVVIHLGASQIEKRYPISSWKTVIEGLSGSGVDVVIVGSSDEKTLAAELAGFPFVRNLVGQTKLSELFSVLGDAHLLIGADSAPIHIASHVGTPTLNLSFASVNFWETGPCSKESFVLCGLTPETLPPKQVIEAARAILSGLALPETLVKGKAADGVRFETSDDSFEWRLIRAMYTHSDYPPLPQDSMLASAVRRLEDASKMALDQIAILKKNPASKSALSILSAVDEVLAELPNMVPSISPLVRWFETERLRIPPGELERTFEQTEKLFNDLLLICEVLLKDAGPDFKELNNTGLTRLSEIESELSDCALSFRFYKMNAAQPKLQRLLDHLSFFERHGLHHSSETKVQAISDWICSYGEYRDVLSRLMGAFEKQDYVQVADLIEYDFQNSVREFRERLLEWQSSGAVLT